MAMLSGAPIALPPEAVAEAKAYLRIVGDDEDALLARAMGQAAELCERFTGQALIARGFTQTLAASRGWMRLEAMPVRAISGVAALSLTGEAEPIAAEGYAIDIDARGDGWVRLTAPIEARRIRVSFEAGLAADWAGAPEAPRQGIVRLAAHFHTHRDGAADAGPPAAVTALWRPWRRMRLT